MWFHGMRRGTRLNRGLSASVQRIPRARRACIRANCAQSADTYAKKLKNAEECSDAVSALTLLAEAQALNVDLAPGIAEVGARTICSLSATKSWKVLQQYVLERGVVPCFKKTLPAVFKGLAAENDASSFIEAVNSLESHLLKISGVGDLEEQSNASSNLQENHEGMRCLNLMLRQLAKFDVDAAVKKANRYYKLGIIIEGGTYSQLAASSLTAGHFSQAEEMLEMRDYL